jgi:hypothetical protein
LSPAIHLGANRLLVIGVGDTQADGAGHRNPKVEPTFGQMFGFMLDSLFMDQLHSDLELIASQNETPGMRRIDALVITPITNSRLAPRWIAGLNGDVCRMAPSP